MDQVKIGKFIAECRKKENLTQMQLAEKLSITDRVISKWENGKAMPDSSIMLELCHILQINVNDLLCGEIVPMENYNKELEKTLLEMVKQKEANDKRLLTLEIITSIVCLLPLIATTTIVSIVPMQEWLATIIVLSTTIPLLIAAPFMLKLEQIAGYYKCTKCGHTYVPTYKSVFIATHIGRTRYMKCPNCHKWSWQKKVIHKK